MYRKNFKSRKIPNTVNSSKNVSFKSVNTSGNNQPEPAQSTSFSNQVQPNVPNIQTKRKSPFDDIDLSDLKFDTTLPSFLNASTSFNVTSEIKPGTKHLKTSNNNNGSLEANEWDFGDDDILDFEEPTKKKTELKLNLSDNDKNAMIKLLVNDSVGKSQVKDDFSDLLDDDFEIDDDDLYDIKTQFSQNKSDRQNVAFRTASGTQLKSNHQSLALAEQLFQNNESIFLKEVACFVWNMKHHFPIPLDVHNFSPISQK